MKAPGAATQERAGEKGTGGIPHLKVRGQKGRASWMRAQKG